MTIGLISASDYQAYSAWVRGHPHGSLWQSLEWKAFQETLGRDVRVYLQQEKGAIVASALVVIDRTSFGLSTWEVPKGPLGGMGRRGSGVGNLIKAILADAQKERSMALYLSPQDTLPPTPRPLRPTKRHQWPEATRIIDITSPEDAILLQMKPKGRYNIGVAKKHGVSVEQSEDIEAFYELLRVTGDRDRFGILPRKHYETFLQSLPGSFLLLARVPTQKKPVAGLLGVLWGLQGMYYYGASSYAERAIMAPYLLQWEAMRHCKAQGCQTYDLLGIAPPGAPMSHPWSGISAFKEKFGGTVVTYPPEEQVVLRPWTERALRWKRALCG